MKKLQLMLALVFGITITAFAQLKPIQTVVIKTPTVQCSMCKEKIEKLMYRVDGVKGVKVNVKAKTTTITFLTDRTGKEMLKAELANIGYDADDVTAEETAYKKLPTCCKKPEDRPAAPPKEGKK